MAFTPKKIYPEDRVFYTTKKEDGSFYIAYTTENKEKKKYGGMEFLKKIPNVPDEEMLTGEQETMPSGAVRYYMRKELPEFQEFLFQECKAVCTDEKNPYIKPKFSLSDYKKSITPATAPEPPAKKQKVEEPPRNTEEIMKEIKEIKRLLILLHTVVGSKNKDSEITITEQPNDDEDDSVDDTGDEHAS